MRPKHDVRLCCSFSTRTRVSIVHSSAPVCPSRPNTGSPPFGWDTTPATFRLAAELEQAGAQPEVLYDLLFEQNSLGRLKLMGLILGRLEVFEDGKIACSEIHRDDYAATGAQPQDTEDMVNFMRSIAGVEVGLFFMEQPRGGVKVSLRSRSRVDVSRVAEGFGGGGHRLASGATLDATLPEARVRVLQAVRTALAAV